ncbi:STAS domain-containing protein [uncultured Streptomyces sp.]|uniref:STAS domain-containing protein n=1 Tax=uncultured Streptomyces sp. TaxID=174707 RepID=UPI00262BCB8A|nr:STAS domain-containing protein [uncultured Streptomyces sp.]
MPLFSYRLDASRTVVELCDPVDLEDVTSTERALLAALPPRAPGALVVDVRTPLLTPLALGVLLRVRRRGEETGVPLAVVARHRTARTVLEVAGLERVLRVAHTLDAAERWTRGLTQGSAAHGAGAPRGRPGGASGPGRQNAGPCGPANDHPAPRPSGGR